MRPIPRYPSSSMYTELLRRQLLQTGLKSKKIRETQVVSGSSTGSLEVRLTSICPKTCPSVGCLIQDGGNANSELPNILNGGNANSEFSIILDGNLCA